MLGNENNRTKFEEDEYKFWALKHKNNDIFYNYADNWNSTIHDILQNEPSFQNEHHNKQLKDKMIEHSPARRTKSIMEFKEKNKLKFNLEDQSYSQIQEEMEKLSKKKQPQHKDNLLSLSQPIGH